MKHHALRYKQPSAAEASLSLQDEESIRQQLRRSIVIACGAAGFDSVNQIALESFHSAVEECELHQADLYSAMLLCCDVQ
jgi:hypothetical protein